MNDQTKRIAKIIAANMTQQNPMLELCDGSDGRAIGVYDDYDNKFYDCEEIAKAVLNAMQEPAE